MNDYMYSQIVVGSIYISLLSLLFLKIDFINIFFSDNSDLVVYTAYFALFIFIGVFNAFNARTHRINIFAKINKNKTFILVFSFIFIAQLFIIYNGGSVFRTYGLTVNELFFVLTIAFSILPLDFIRKIYLKSKGLKTGV